MCMSLPLVLGLDVDLVVLVPELTYLLFISFSEGVKSLFLIAAFPVFFRSTPLKVYPFIESINVRLLLTYMCTKNMANEQQFVLQCFVRLIQRP